MKKISLSSLMIFALALTTLSACGGGGGGGGSTPPQSTPAVLTLSTAVTGAISAPTVITGYDVTITLPAGVTVKSTTPPQTDAGVVVGTVNGALAGASYSPATGKVHIIIVSPNGNGFTAAGEFCKVKCDIAAGQHPTAADFQQQPIFTASGLDTAKISTVDLTGQLSLKVTAAIN